MNNFENNIKQALIILKKEANIIVQGQNKNIESYYNIWRGAPAWQKYKYWVNGYTKEANYKTLNMPRYICRTWANNYANEDTKLTIPSDKSNDRLQEILTKTNLFGRFNNFCEMFMGLGVGATVVELDLNGDENGNLKVANENTDIKIRMIPGRRIIPITVEDGEVTECAFVSYGTGNATLTIFYLVDGKYHQAKIKGTANTNNGNYEFDFKSIVDIELDTIPLFQIWSPNLTDEDELDNEVGTSIFATALDTFKHLDLGYTAYYKEVKLGQKVKFISTDNVNYDENGNPIPQFDEEDESIIYLKNATDAPNNMQEFNGQLRIDALTKFINTNLNCAAMLCGLGQTQFEFDGGGGRPIQTATGVIAKQTELYRNVIKQENLATDRFRKLVMAIAYVNNTFLTSKPKIEIKSITDIQVVYDDNIVEDTSTKKTNELAEVNAGVMSIAEFRSHWYDEDYESALKFVQDNALMLDKYQLALTSYVITPEMFVDLTFGENCKNKQELVDYITEHLTNNNTGIDANDLSDEADDEEEEETPEEEEKPKGDD